MCPYKEEVIMICKIRNRFVSLAYIKHYTLEQKDIFQKNTILHVN